MSEATPIPAHLGSEFLLWLWWASEARQNQFDLERPVGRVELWVDDRLAFRQPADAKVSAVLTGENPASAPEARAALSGGKVLQDLRLGLRRDDREFSVTLRGPTLDLSGLKLDQALRESTDEAILDRMTLVEELSLVLRALFAEFASVRAGSGWPEQVHTIRAWLEGRAA